MDYRKLADLLFPDVTDTPAEVEARYPCLLYTSDAADE